MRPIYRDEFNSSTAYNVATTPDSPIDLQPALSFSNGHVAVTTCATCGRRLVLRAEYSGQEIACRHCGSPLRVSVPGNA